MKKQNHTPGPWRVHVHKDAPIQRRFLIKPENHLSNIGAVYVTNNHDAEANARLMAASPLLLEALQGFAELFRSDAFPKSQGERFLLAKAEAAIAKATGGDK